MVTTEALKLLYKKLGGTADVDNITAISDMIDLIEDVAGGGGGASGLLVSVSGSPKSMALDKSYNELKTVLDNGIMPVFNMHMAEEGQPTFDMYNFVLLGLMTGEAEGTTVYQAILRMDSTDGGDPTFLEMGALDADEPLAEVY